VATPSPGPTEHGNGGGDGSWIELRIETKKIFSGLAAFLRFNTWMPDLLARNACVSRKTFLETRV
jgi:hypothetical protein